MIRCDEQQKETVIGSRDHEIKGINSLIPEILANGISTTDIIATVYSKEGAVAQGMHVVFETTYGAIERNAVTNILGEARVTLTSQASQVDLNAVVKATVLDTSYQSLPKGNAEEYGIKLNVPGYEINSDDNESLNKQTSALQNTDEIMVKLLGVTLTASIQDSIMPADGLTETEVTVKLQETTSQRPVELAIIYLGAQYGSIQGSVSTGSEGSAHIYLTAGKPEHAGNDTLNIKYGNKITSELNLTYKKPSFEISTNTSQTLADGKSTIDVTATLLSHKNTPIIGAEVMFSTTDGIIPESGFTDQNGKATVSLISGKYENSEVIVQANYWSLKDSVQVAFINTIEDYPNSITLEASPNFIWVKETGNLEQTTISATVLGGTGLPVGNDFRVKFTIANSPGGGITIEPSGANENESDIVNTINGVAQAHIRSGIRSGTVQIKAELIDYHDIESTMTNLVIRSGPPYMWVNPNNANNVIPHATVAIEPGKANVAFANPIEEIKITAYFGDKYNNPVEDGTAIYFTTTGGIITTDALTNNKGQTAVTLQNVHPFPYLYTQDPNQLNARYIPNPNDDNIYLDYPAPGFNFNYWDFEGGEILNTIGNYIENDGIAVVLAYTWGQNQDNPPQPIKVWAPLKVIYSVGVHTFTASIDRDTLRIGETANIDIRLFDMNGNPVAAGSKLGATTNVGKIAPANLMPDPENYGWGTTYFGTQLVNNLDPLEDKAELAVITISLDSPNGSGSRVVSCYLRID